MAEGLTVVLSADGSGGFNSALAAGSSGVLVDGGEEGMAGSGIGTGGSSTSLVAFAFLDLT